MLVNWTGRFGLGSIGTQKAQIIRGANKTILQVLQHVEKQHNYFNQ